MEGERERGREKKKSALFPVPSFNIQSGGGAAPHSYAHTHRLPRTNSDMAAGSTTTLGEGRGCRWGILSCGKIANDFATALRLVDGVVHLEENGGGGGGGAKDAAAAAAAAGRHSHSVVACAASSQQRAAEFGAKHGVSPERCYGDYAELARDLEVDVVYVASIHTQHKEHVMKLLECGKHVLCEKPMAVCARDVRAMVDKAREKGVFMMEGEGEEGVRSTRGSSTYILFSLLIDTDQ